MIIQLDSATTESTGAARHSLEELARSWGHQIAEASAEATAAAWASHDDGKAIDPVAVASLVLSVPSAALAVADRAAVAALACQLPAATGVPLAHWTGPELAAELAARELARPMSPSSVLRILAEHPVRPWRYQSWIYPRDPDFAAKAKVIVDLYQGCYGGEPLGAGDRILSFDAKPQINARRRLHPVLPAAPGRPVRYEHEYKRQGSLALLAGMDVHTGQVFASTPATTGIKPFTDLAGQVLTRPEYHDAPRVFVIVDNGSDHRGQAAITGWLGRTRTPS